MQNAGRAHSAFPQSLLGPECQTIGVRHEKGLGWGFEVEGRDGPVSSRFLCPILLAFELI